mgnify:FL=1
MAISIDFNGEQIETDSQGYLLDYSLWQEELALVMAKQDKFELTAAHWEVIRFVRQFYLTYNMVCEVRLT